MYQYEKNILITGVAGFIASNLACYLVKKYSKYFFLGIDKISYCSNIKNFDEIKNYNNFKFVKADFTNLEFMDYLFGEYKIDHVLHLGAYTHVDMSFGDSITYTKNNILGTHCLLEVSNKHNIKLFILTSTDEVYGSKDHQSTEFSQKDSSNPYSSTKSAAEEIARSYFHSFKLPLIIVRPNNIYGGKAQYPEKVIPKFILKMLNKESLTIQGSGNQKRSFLHVDDVCKAFDIIFHKGAIGEIYNIGCKNEISILELAQKLIQHFGYGKIQHVEDRPFNDQRYFISSDKLEALGWKQEINFDEGLLQTIQWYTENQNYFN
jgi:UDP-glucose 4,6-dehydratase